MNRKGKLTTKGKHAVILTLTIVACVAAMLFSCYFPCCVTENMYLLRRIHKMIHIRASWQEARGRRPTC